jgi:hypothetical protein
MLMMQNVPTTGLPGLKVSDAKLPRSPLSITAQTLTDFLNQDSQSRLSPELNRPLLMPFEIALRSKGQLIFSQWLEGHSPYRAINDVLNAEPASDLLQLTIVISRRALSQDNWQSELSAEKNGRSALEITLHGATEKVSPFETIATNRSLERWFEIRLKQKALTVGAFFALGGQIALFECHQFALPCQEQSVAFETYRGSGIVEKDSPATILADQIISGISRWFMTNQEKDGALPYKYWPSAGTYSEADNPIRRFMASVVFNRLADALDSQNIRAAARRNLTYNLNRFYRTMEGNGAIYWNESVKLGALAISGQAIIESPYHFEWRDQLDAIRKTIDKLWQPSGAFRTFLYPHDRNDNQNFYPGEALVFWATSLAQDKHEGLLNRALKSLEYYRGHFHKRPNPAFVPWHSQAATTIYRLTGEIALRDYVFEMNDWLLPHQQWGGELDRDYWGRFYTPSKPEYGPPHASATGVYLEGLVDALALAQEAGDRGRAELYLEAIERGIRSIAQLQFRDYSDAFYISRPERVIGAVRTESDNNEIRIDNMQHALAALLKFKALSKDFSNRTVLAKTATQGV